MNDHCMRFEPLDQTDCITVPRYCRVSRDKTSIECFPDNQRVLIELKKEGVSSIKYSTESSNFRNLSEILEWRDLKIVVVRGNFIQIQYKSHEVLSSDRYRQWYCGERYSCYGRDVQVCEDFLYYINESGHLVRILLKKARYTLITEYKQYLTSSKITRISSERVHKNIETFFAQRKRVATMTRNGQITLLRLSSSSSYCPVSSSPSPCLDLPLLTSPSFSSIIILTDRKKKMVVGSYCHSSRIQSVSLLLDYKQVCPPLYLISRYPILSIYRHYRYDNILYMSTPISLYLVHIDHSNRLSLLDHMDCSLQGGMSWSKDQDTGWIVGVGGKLAGIVNIISGGINR